LSLLAADAAQQAALLEVRGRLRSARRKAQSGVPASRWGAVLWRVLRFGCTAAAVAVAVILIMAAAGIIASHAVSGFDLRTQVLLMVGKACTCHQPSTIKLAEVMRTHVALVGCSAADPIRCQVPTLS